MKEMLERIGRVMRVLEDSVLVGVFVAMLLLAVAQILLRNVFDTGFSWIGPMLRISVLWVGMLGAVVATRQDRHINIDVLSRFAPPAVLPWMKRVTGLVTAGICALLAWHTFRFVRDERAWSDFEVAGVPVWIWQAILPVGFGLMAWRFLYMVFFPPRRETIA